MIPFFRKTRKKMADDNKPIKYMRYAIGEIVLVVVGILIALSINNWNEERKNDVVRRNYYLQILQDLEKDKINMEKRILRTDSLLVNYQSYEEIFKEPDLPIWEIFSGMSSLGGGNRDWNIESNTNTINTLLSTGDIKLIPPILRNKILDFKNKQSGLKDYRKTVGGAMNIAKMSSTTIYGGWDLVKRMGNQPKLMKYYEDENISIQTLLGIEAEIYEGGKIMVIVKKRYTELILDVEGITKLINEEIKE